MKPIKVSKPTYILIGGAAGGVSCAILGILVGFFNILHWLSIIGIMFTLPKIANKIFTVDD